MGELVSIALRSQTSKVERRFGRNLDKHVRNLRSFGQTVIVAFNKFASDTDEEMELLREHCEQLGVGYAINNAFQKVVKAPLIWRIWWLRQSKTNHLNHYSLPIMMKIVYSRRLRKSQPIYMVQAL